MKLTLAFRKSVLLVVLLLLHARRHLAPLALRADWLSERRTRRRDGGRGDESAGRAMRVNRFVWPCMVMLLLLLGLAVTSANLVTLLDSVTIGTSIGSVCIRTRKLSVRQCGERCPAAGDAVGGSDCSLARLLLLRMVRRWLTCGDARA